MRKLLFILVMSSLCLLVSCEGAGGGGSSGGGGGSSSGGGGSGDSFIIDGTVSFISDLIISKGHAGEFQACSSSCNQRKESCASLFVINNDGSESLVCDVKVDQFGSYSFDLSDKNAVSGKNVKIYVNDFKGNKREVVAKIDSGDARKSLNIDSRTTIDSILKVDKIKNGEGVTQGQMVHTYLKLMCPAVINDSNVSYVIQNSMGYLASNFSRSLLVDFRKKYDAGQDMSSISASITTFCNYVSSILALDGTGNKRLKLVDKYGSAYANLRFWLAYNHDGLLSSSSGTGAFYTTDVNGEVDISALGNGGYSFIRAEATSDPLVFLWASNWKYIGHIEIVSDKDMYRMILPRIKQYEKSYVNFAPNLLSTFKNYYAQSFTLSSETEFCGVGFGLGLGGNGSPYSLQIRADNNGKPSSNVLYESKVLKFTGAVSYGREAGYADMCENLSGLAKVSAGKYWVVAKYLELPTTNISVLGDIALASNGESFLASDDGLNWSNYGISVWYNGNVTWKRLEFFLTE